MIKLKKNDFDHSEEETIDALNVDKKVVREAIGRLMLDEHDSITELLENVMKNCEDINTLLFICFMLGNILSTQAAIERAMHEVTTQHGMMYR